MTDLTEVKAADLAGEPLNWSVAIAMGLSPSVVPAQYGVPARVFIQQEGMFPVRYKPAVDWQVGGPLIEKNHVDLHYPHGLPGRGWMAQAGTQIEERPIAAADPTPLVAVCRAIVANKLGETVQVPKELLP